MAAMAFHCSGPPCQRLLLHSAALGIGVAILLIGARALAQQQRGPQPFEVLEACQLVTNTAVDGDSFRIVHKEREYAFRLYFVDTPETDASLKDRITDQAAYFGISQDDIPRAGTLAARFTREKLSAREFTVITRWQNAMGRGTLARFYAIVLVGGKNLAEELVGQGLARIYGLRATWPDNLRATTFTSQLKNVELEAREKKRGVWNEKEFPRVADAAGSAAKQGKAGKSPSPTSPLDINTASFEELQALPGIGPKLAERIIAHRPYSRIDDLDKVQGIGAKTLERLRPLVRVESKTP